MLACSSHVKYEIHDPDYIMVALDSGLNSYLFILFSDTCEVDGSVIGCTPRFSNGDSNCISRYKYNIDCKNRI